MSSILSNINYNADFDIGRHAQAIALLQEQAATGLRVNRVSDDPSAAYRILGLQSQQSRLKSNMDLISDTMTTLEATSTTIENVRQQLTDVKKNITQIVTGTYGEDSRKITAQAIEDTIEHILSLANSKSMDRYLFGGTDTSSKPYTATKEQGRITQVDYQGSDDSRMVELASGVESPTCQIGREVFGSNEPETPVFTGTTCTQAGSGTSSVKGFTWLTVEHNEAAGEYILSINDGQDTVAVPDDGSGNANQPVIDSKTGRILYVDTTTIENAGTDLVNVPGTNDVFDMLITIRDILRNDRGLSEEQFQDTVSLATEAFQEINNSLSQVSVTVGSRIGFLDNLNQSIDDIHFNIEEEKSKLEEADITQIVIDLAQRQTLYQMSLSVAARLMSTSLLDFIR